MKLFRAIYAFCFYRCLACGKRLPANMLVCNDECGELAAEMQIFSM